MINTQELQIGNLVLHHGKPMKVIGVSRSFVDLQNGDVTHHVPARNVEPIKLDARQLIFANFHGGDDSLWTNGVVELSYITTDEHYQTEITFPNMQWQLLKIEHLHTLQNLHFQISAKQMEFKTI